MTASDKEFRSRVRWMRSREAERCSDSPPLHIVAGTPSLVSEPPRVFGFTEEMRDLARIIAAKDRSPDIAEWASRLSNDVMNADD